MRYHIHSDQLHTKESQNIRTGEITLESYCLTCGEKIHSVQLKDSEQPPITRKSSDVK